VFLRVLSSACHDALTVVHNDVHFRCDWLQLFLIGIWIALRRFACSKTFRVIVLFFLFYFLAFPGVSDAEQWLEIHNSVNMCSFLLYHYFYYSDTAALSSIIGV